MKRKTGDGDGFFTWAKGLAGTAIIAWLTWVSNTLVKLESKVNVLEYAVLQKTQPTLLSHNPQPPKFRLVDFEHFIFNKGEKKDESKN